MDDDVLDRTIFHVALFFFVVRIVRIVMVLRRRFRFQVGRGTRTLEDASGGGEDGETLPCDLRVSSGGHEWNNGHWDAVWRRFRGRQRTRFASTTTVALRRAWLLGVYVLVRNFVFKKSVGQRLRDHGPVGGGFVLRPLDSHVVRTSSLQRQNVRGNRGVVTTYFRLD